jgi:lipoyl(octanoyl) transferase
MTPSTPPSQTIERTLWRRSTAPVAYPEAVAAMEAHVTAIRRDGAEELVWLLEHPPLYTAGTSTNDDDILDTGGLPVYRTGRGGRMTYHGPGQRVGYAILDLKQRGADVRRYVRDLEEWLIRALARLGVTGERRDGRVGIWVVLPGGAGEAKIAAIGVRIRHWVSYHGVSLNVDPDLSRFGGIVPCGISEHGVTSLAQLGIKGGMTAADEALRDAFVEVFGPVREGG